jgi:hypothetical protein
LQLRQLGSNSERWRVDQIAGLRAAGCG